jgi:hypothetical protein
MADQFLDLILETKGRHDNYKRYLHGWNDCLDVLKQKIREWRAEPPDQLQMDRHCYIYSIPK